MCACYVHVRTCVTVTSKLATASFFFIKYKLDYASVQLRTRRIDIGWTIDNFAHSASFNFRSQTQISAAEARLNRVFLTARARCTRHVMACIVAFIKTPAHVVRPAGWRPVQFRSACRFEFCKVSLSSTPFCINIGIWLWVGSNWSFWRRKITEAVKYSKKPFKESIEIPR